ncbi:MAG: helix-turn-helix transcriptional regulator [Paracoccaceae bacterium]|nr:helix-turn-helix transcriptional regulator [Paracoccaceae bacterium]
MRALPNAAEDGLGRSIRRVGGKGFEAALHAWLGRCLPLDNIIVLAYRDVGPPEVLYRHADRAEVFARLESVYLAGAYLLDPFHELHTRRAPAGLYRLRDIAPDRFQSTRYVRDYYERTTILDELTYVAYPAEGVSLNICLGRDAGSGQAFSAREVETATRLAPVVQALAEAHWAELAAEPGRAGDLARALRDALAAAQGIHLSPRQAEVALLILRGHSSVSIALRLGLSPQTVKVFRRQLYARCGLSSQAELFALMMPLLGRMEALG